MDFDFKVYAIHIPDIFLLIHILISHENEKKKREIMNIQKNHLTQVVVLWKYL